MKIILKNNQKFFLILFLFKQLIPQIQTQTFPLKQLP
jgi:hypothetical protein